jgi:hypothetical protein
MKVRAAGIMAGSSENRATMNAEEENIEDGHTINAEDEVEVLQLKLEELGHQIQSLKVEKLSLTRIFSKPRNQWNSSQKTFLENLFPNFLANINVTNNIITFIRCLIHTLYK